MWRLRVLRVGRELVPVGFKQDIDTRRGERMVRLRNDVGCVLFYGQAYSHPNLDEWVGFPVIVCGYGYSAVDVYLIERKCKGWGRGKFLCMIIMDA